MDTYINDKAKGKSILRKILVGIFAAICVIVAVFPLLFSLLSSFKDNGTIYSDPFGMPKIFSLKNYVFAFQSTNVLRGMVNSLLYAFVSVAIIILFSLCIAYAIRIKVPFSGFVFLFFIAGMALPVHAILVPLAALIGQLHLKNTVFGLLGIYVATNLSLSVFFVTGYMKGISKEMDESATIDGCGPLRTLFQIIAPLTAPVVSTVSIISFLHIYNDLIFSILLIDNKAMSTISYALLAFKSQYDINYGGTFAGICTSIFPMIIVYILLQKKIQGGITAGSVKG